VAEEKERRKEEGKHKREEKEEANRYKAEKEEARKRSMQWGKRKPGSTRRQERGRVEERVRSAYSKEANWTP